jgi:peptidyl-prolyl cis-trans isomerase A (cyclophilin A)
MKLALLAVVMCAASWAQTKEAPKAAPKAAAKAEVMDVLKPNTIKGKAPDTFIARLETTKGNIDIKVTRSMAANGADRFYNLVRAGYYDNIYFFRVIPGFMVQFGMSSKPAVNRVWADRNMLDDRVVSSNKRGMLTYAKTSEPNSRSTQLFINTGNNARLDADGFAPFGEVTVGMDVVDAIYSGYAEQPDQGRISLEGEAYLMKFFPRLDKIVKATILP